MELTDTTPKKVAQRREHLRRELEAAGLRPREADARASIAQTYLADFTRPGGLV